MNMAALDLVLIRGGGDLASGIALRLHHAGFKSVIGELPQPLAVRRAVSFSEAVYAGQQTVEDVTARRVEPGAIRPALEAGEIPVLVDPDAQILASDDLNWLAVIDARMLKRAPETLLRPVPLHVGLGPGFHAGRNCDAVVETRRGHTLGRVYWLGPAQADSGRPDGDPGRVLRAPAPGRVIARARIGEHVEAGATVAVIQTQDGKELQVVSSLSGMLRGLIREGISVAEGLKIGDVDPRDDAAACFLVSDKSLAVAGGVLEALLTPIPRMSEKR